MTWETIELLTPQRHECYYNSRGFAVSAIYIHAVYIVYSFIVAITFVTSLCYMDEWESGNDSEERDGGDYLEEQDQKGEELELFYEAGQRDHLVLGQILYHSRNSTARICHL